MPQSDEIGDGLTTTEISIPATTSKGNFHSTFLFLTCQRTKCDIYRIPVLVVASLGSLSLAWPRESSTGARPERLARRVTRGKRLQKPVVAYSRRSRPYLTQDDGTQVEVAGAKLDEHK